MRSALVLAVAMVAGGFVSPATTRTRHLGVGLLVPITAVPALALRSIPLARSSPTSHRCSPTSMGPPDRSGRRLGGRKPDEQPPAAQPRADEQRAALSRADELPATFRAITRYGYQDLLGEMATSMATLLPEPTAVIAFAGGILRACVQLAAMLLLAYAIYYSSGFHPAVDAVIKQVSLPLCTCVLCWPSRRTTSKSTDPLRSQVRDPRFIRGSPDDPKKASKQLITPAIAMLHLTQTLEGSWNEDSSILSVTAFFLEGRAIGGRARAKRAPSSILDERADIYFDLRIGAVWPDGASGGAQRGLVLCVVKRGSGVQVLEERDVSSLVQGGQAVVDDAWVCLPLPARIARPIATRVPDLLSQHRPSPKHT